MIAESAQKHHATNVTKLFVSVPGAARLLVQGACGCYWLLYVPISTKVRNNLKEILERRVHQTVNSISL